MKEYLKDCLHAIAWALALNAIFYATWFFCESAQTKVNNRGRIEAPLKRR